MEVVMYSCIAVVLCGDDIASLEVALTASKYSSEYANVRRLFLFDRVIKRYELPLALNVAIDEICNSETDKLFTNSSNVVIQRQIAEHIMESMDDALFFLQAGDAFHNLYPNYLEAFFQYNHEKCGVVYVPVINSESTLLPIEVENLSKSGIFAIDENFPGTTYGAAVTMKDLKAAGLDPSLGFVMFENALNRIVVAKGRYGRMNKVAIQKDTSLYIVKKASKITGALHGNFLISCIIPIYNVEAYLYDAINSVITQTIGFEETVQLILINDGSPDNSADICREYLEKYPNNVVYIAQENRGVSAARNAGLDIASAKYITFLDADDTFSDNYFDVGIKLLLEHSESIDVVSFQVVSIKGSHELEHPLNYKFTKGTRIIDLHTEPNSIQTRVASAIFTQASIGDIRFPLGIKYAEDTYFVWQVLQAKLKYCVTSDAKYMYRRDNENAATFDPKSFKGMYQQTVLWEKYCKDSIRIFGRVIPYVQKVILYIIQWMTGEPQFEIDVDKIRAHCKAVLTYFDDQMIIQHSKFNIWQKLHLLKLKGSPIPFPFIHDLSARKLWIQKVEEHDGILYVYGFVSLQTLSGLKARVIARIKENVYEATLSENDWKKSWFLGEIVNTETGFDFEIDLCKLSDSADVYFYIEQSNGFICEGNLAFSIRTPLSSAMGFATGQNWIVSYHSEIKYALKLRKYNQQLLQSMWDTRSKSLERYEEDIRLIRNSFFGAYQWLSKKRIWLFMDLNIKAGQSAEYIFRYANQQDDGIEKYFVIDDDSPDYERMAQYGKVIKFGSELHKTLLLFAECFICSFFDYFIRYPFGDTCYEKNSRTELYRCLMKNKYIYTQHGIAKGDFSGNFNRWRKDFNKIVISSDYEKIGMLSSKYSFREKDFICTGNPRNDALYNNKKNKIVIMFTWNNNFNVGIGVYNEAFKNSDYCQKLNAIIFSEALVEVADSFGYDVLFKPHHRQYVQLDDLKIHPKIELVPVDVQLADLIAESAMLITDYSSIQDDFAYLQKPIVYYPFHPYHRGEQFDHEGFGPIVSDVETMVAAVKHYLTINCEMEVEYKNRAKSFFYYSDSNNTKRTYEAIKALLP